MLKKLAVPFLTLALATFGCSSSTSNNGTGGSGGAAGGKGGGAGTSAAGGKGGGAAGSSAAGTSGGGGAAGSSAAGSGGGGKAGGGGSAAAGSSGGGAAGSSAAGTNGGGGAGGAAGAAGGHPGGGTNGKPDASFMADCNVTTSTGTDKLSAPVFCTNLFAYCSNISGLTLPATEKACEDMYTSSGQEHCRSYHLCWGVEGITMDGGVGKPMVHCPHTLGMNNVCVATTDAASGN